MYRTIVLYKTLKNIYIYKTLKKLYKTYIKGTSFKKIIQSQCPSLGKDYRSSFAGQKLDRRLP